MQAATPSRRHAVVSRLTSLSLMLTLAPLGAGLLGCGGGGVEDYMNASFRVGCQKLFECCTADEIANMNNGLLSFSSEEACVEAYEKVAAAFGLSALAEAEEEGRIRFDSARADACLAEAEALSCDDHSSDLADLATDCEGVITPQVEDGATCKNDIECISGVCEGGSLFGDTTGTCRALQKEGEVCDGFNCAEGYGCVADASSGKSTCEPLPTEGQECFYECAGDLYCDSSSTTAAATCKPRKPGGASCTNFRECRSLDCDTTEGSPGTCAAEAGMCG